MVQLFGQMALRFPRLDPSLTRDLPTGLCVFLFTAGFVLWFLRYVRVEKPDPGERDL